MKTVITVRKQLIGFDYVFLAFNANDQLIDKFQTVNGLLDFLNVASVLTIWE